MMMTEHFEKHSLFFTWMLLLSLLYLHCGIYSFKGSLPPHLHTIAIPLFENRTAEFGVPEELTDAIIEKFTQDNSLKIADRSNADVILEGTIVRINDRAGAYNSQERVQDLKIYLTINVKCMDQVKRQVLWEGRLTQWGSYDPSEGPDARLDGLNDAIDKVSEEILNKTVSGW